MSSEDDKRDPNIVEYLINSLLEERCTPVLGAGISFYASATRFAPAEKSYPHRCPEMCKSLTKALGPCVAEQEDENQKNATNENRQNDTLGKLCQKFVWNKGQGAAQELVKLLCIDKFWLLQPTAGHYYLALLAREGLISDVITTNYDCCLERAYMESWGYGEVYIDKFLRPEEFPIGENRKPVVRLYDRDSFSRLGAVQRWKIGEDKEKLGKPYVLRVHKTNGCSAAIGDPDLKRSDLQSAYKQILLTEVQLQDWRERQWAADLFRHKLRTTSLFFCGFGSDEPQILHTLQKVFEECEHNPRIHGSSFDSWEDHSNVPIISVFEPEPSFSHQYIARQYMKGMSFGLSNEWKDLLFNRDVYNAMFYPNACFEQRTLPADDQLREVFHSVFHHLVLDALDFAIDSSEASFTAVLPLAKHFIRKARIDWEQRGDSEVVKLLMQGASPWGKKNVGHAFPTLPLLSRLLVSLCFPAETGTWSYSTVSDHKSLTAEIVTLFSMLQMIKERCADAEDRDGGNIRLVAPFPHQGHVRCFLQGRPLYLAAHSQEVNLKEQKAEFPTGQTVCLELLLGGAGASHEAQRYRRKELRDGVPPQNRFASLVQLCWRDIFGDMNSSQWNEASVLDRLEDAIRRPSKYYARHRKSIRNFPKCKPAFNPMEGVISNE